MFDDVQDGRPGTTDAQHRREHEWALLRRSIEALGEAVIITDPELEQPGPRIQYVNPAFTRITGYSAEEVTGRSPRLLHGPRTDRVLLDRVRAALKAGHNFHGETVNYRKDGGEYLVEWLITPVLNGGRIEHWIAVLRDVTEQRRATEQIRLLAREVDHRAKNLLALVQSILQLTPGSDVAAFRQAVLGRVLTLARAQTLLADDRWTGASLYALLKGEIAPFRNALHHVRLEGPQVMLPPGVAQPLAMAVHELATNAVKHGALSVPGGSVAVTWNVGSGVPDTLQLRWSETGGPIVTDAPRRRGFGTRVLDGTVRAQLGGTLRLSWEPSGMVCEIAVPLRQTRGFGSESGAVRSGSH